MHAAALECPCKRSQSCVWASNFASSSLLGLGIFFFWVLCWCGGRSVATSLVTLGSLWTMQTVDTYHNMVPLVRVMQKYTKDLLSADLKGKDWSSDHALQILCSCFWFDLARARLWRIIGAKLLGMLCAWAPPWLKRVPWAATSCISTLLCCQLFHLGETTVQSFQRSIPSFGVQKLTMCDAFSRSLWSASSVIHLAQPRSRGFAIQCPWALSRMKPRIWKGFWPSLTILFLLCIIPRAQAKQFGQFGTAVQAAIHNTHLMAAQWFFKKGQSADSRSYVGLQTVCPCDHVRTLRSTPTLPIIVAVRTWSNCCCSCPHWAWREWGGWGACGWGRNYWEWRCRRGGAKRNRWLCRGRELVRPVSLWLHCEEPACASKMVLVVSWISEPSIIWDMCCKCPQRTGESKQDCLHFWNVCFVSSGATSCCAQPLPRGLWAGQAIESMRGHVKVTRDSYIVFGVCSPFNFWLFFWVVWSTTCTLLFLMMMLSMANACSMAMLIWELQVIMLGTMCGLEGFLWSDPNGNACHGCCDCTTYKTATFTIVCKNWMFCTGPNLLDDHPFLHTACQTIERIKHSYRLQFGNPNHFGNPNARKIPY